MQVPRLARAERRRRLVHHDQPRVARERAQDLDLLLLGGAQPSGRHASRQVVEAGRLGQLGVRAVERAGAGRTPASLGSTPRKTFCATVRCGTIDGSCAIAATPCSSASRGERNDTSRAVEQHPCRASGACTPATMRPSVDLPAPFSPTSACTDPRRDRERHVRERLDAAEVLGDVQELEVGRLASPVADDSSRATPP